MRNRLVRAIVAAGRLPPAPRGAVYGLLLGGLSDARLRALDERYYEGEAVYRTAAWNERGLFDWERAAIDAHFTAARRVVVVGCGGGRQVLALRESGFDAIGYESHPALAAFAAELLAAHGHPGCIRPVPRDTFPAGDRCDGVVMGWGTYSLVHGREARVAFLRAARERLEAGGPVLTSFFQRAVLGRELELTRALAGLLRRAARRTGVELGDTLAPNRVHVFDRDQVAAEAAAAGLRVRAHATIAPAAGPTDYALAVLGT